MIGHPLSVARHLYRATSLVEYKGNPGDEHFIKWYWEIAGTPIKRSRIKFNLMRSDTSWTPPLYNTGGDIPETEDQPPIKVGHRDEDDVR